MSPSQFGAKLPLMKWCLHCARPHKDAAPVTLCDGGRTCVVLLFEAVFHVARCRIPSKTLAFVVLARSPGANRCADRWNLVPWTKAMEKLRTQVLDRTTGTSSADEDMGKQLFIVMTYDPDFSDFLNPLGNQHA